MLAPCASQACMVQRDDVVMTDDYAIEFQNVYWYD
jgi:hypothetical protein